MIRLAISALAAIAMFAQAPAVRPTSWERVQATPKRYPARIGTTATRADGFMVSAGPESTEIEHEGKPMVIPRAEVVHVWRMVAPGRRKWLTAAGAGAGFLGGVVVASAAFTDESCVPGCEEYTAVGVAALAGGPIDGGLAGWKLSGKPKAVLVYARPDRAP